MDLSKVFESIDYSYTKITSPEEAVWKEQPVTLKEFVESERFLNFPLFPKQLAMLQALVGDDPKLTFAKKEDYISMAIAVWGKGSGKDTVSAIFVNYLLHVLSCLYNPQTYLELGDGEYIDIINVSYTGEQAKNVFFAKLTQRFLRCPWFRDRYTIYQRDRAINEKGKPEVRITSDRITFPNNIRAISENSSNESYEGYNILVWIMDEASAFRSQTKSANANNIFGTLKTSASSRFGVRAKGCILSFPRHEKDFTLKMYELAQKELHIYADRAPTWEVNLKVDKNDPAILEDYRIDPEGSKMKYECFTADTKISLVDGREVTIVDIVKEFNQGKTLYTYSIDYENEKVVPGRITKAAKTRSNAEIIKVTLDNNETIQCTPDHLFMLRDGSYGKAKELTCSDSLMPLYRKYRKICTNGNCLYELLLSPFENRYHYTHSYFTGKLPRGKLRHHRDFNSRNNTPENFKVMSQDDHTALHNQGHDAWSRGLTKETSSILRGASEKIKANWQNPSYRERMLKAKEKIAEKLRGIPVSEKRKAQISQTLKEGYRTGRIKSWHSLENPYRTCPVCEKEFRAKTEEQGHCSLQCFGVTQRGRTPWNKGLKLAYNHKIISIEKDISQDVYDITVDKYNNFALSSGVFVHNCIPPKQEDAFIKYPDRIHQCIDKGRPPIATYEEYVGPDESGIVYVQQKLVCFNISRQPDIRKYCGWVDLSLTTDITTLNIAHAQGDVLIQDLILQWIPQPENKFPVSILNVQNVIIDLKKRLINLVVMGFDQFNSASTIQYLNTQGIAAQKIRLDIADYQSMKSRLYTSRIRLLDYPPQTIELEYLKIINGLKVDHDDEHTKDITDGLCGCVKLLTLPIKMKTPSRKILPPPDERESSEGTLEGDDVFPGMGVYATLK